VVIGLCRATARHFMNAAKFRGEKKSCFYQLSVLFPILKRMDEKLEI
jgi:hypothetical protein